MLAFQPECAAAGRRIVLSCLRDWAPETTQEVEGDATLVVSELLANAFAHARPISCGMAPRIVRVLELQISLRNEELLIAVGDGAPDRLPVLGTAENEDESGRGLALVGRLSTGWGVEHSAPDVKRVWAALPLARSSIF